mmetsp:Transcript_74584/g.228225  ORF Transcript_74584/g.228225 Transcript_74584/m.228225 type:complete len:305 (-) Transcript_74584:52-966(-)
MVTKFDVRHRAGRHHRRDHGWRYGHPAEHVLRGDRRASVHQRHVLGLRPDVGVRVLRTVAAAGCGTRSHGLVARGSRLAGRPHRGPMSRVVRAGRRGLGPVSVRVVSRGIHQARVHDGRCRRRHADCREHLQVGLSGVVFGASRDERLHERGRHHHRPQPVEVHSGLRHPEVPVRVRFNREHCPRLGQLQVHAILVRMLLLGLPHRQQKVGAEVPQAQDDGPIGTARELFPWHHARVGHPSAARRPSCQVRGVHPVRPHAHQRHGFPPRGRGQGFSHCPVQLPHRLHGVHRHREEPGFETWIRD